MVRVPCSRNRSKRGPRPMRSSRRTVRGSTTSMSAGRSSAALTKLGVWQRVSGRLVRGENVRTALAYVARGEAPLGIVYQTDAQAEKRVRVVGVFPEDTHPTIISPVA